ncbi:MAG: PAS domain S-box protein, partial [Lutibacter sp.]
MFKINKNTGFYQNQDIFNILFEAIPGGIFIIDQLTNIIAVNTVAEKMFGYEKGELLNQSKDILLPKRYLSSHKNQLNYFTNQINKGKNARGLYLFGLTKSNTEFPVEISINQFTIYAQEYMMVLVID